MEGEKEGDKDGLVGGVGGGGEGFGKGDEGEVKSPSVGVGRFQEERGDGGYGWVKGGGDYSLPCRGGVGGEGP